MADDLVRTHDPAPFHRLLRNNGKLHPDRKGKILHLGSKREYADVLFTATFPLPSGDDYASYRALVRSKLNGLPAAHVFYNRTIDAVTKAWFRPRITDNSSSIELTLCGWCYLSSAQSFHFGSLLPGLAADIKRYIPNLFIGWRHLYAIAFVDDEGNGPGGSNRVDMWEVSSTGGGESPTGEMRLATAQGGWIFGDTVYGEGNVPTAVFKYWKLDHIPLCTHGGWRETLAALREARGFPEWYR